MTKTFKVERKGKQTWVAVRQMAHDPQFKIGSHIPGLGKVVAVGETAVFSSPRLASEYGNDEIRWPDGLQHY